MRCISPRSSTRLLEQTGGNLYVLNLVNRIGEISDTEQIRLADNLATMDDVCGITLAVDGTWINQTGQGRNQHAVRSSRLPARCSPIIFVELYQDRSLVRRGLIPPHSDPRGWTRAEVAASMDRVREEAAAGWYSRFTQGFYGALVEARQVVGRCMAHVMLMVSTRDADIRSVVAARFLEAAAALGQASIMWDLLENFRPREIDPRPFLTIAIPPGTCTVGTPGFFRDQASRAAGWACSSGQIPAPIVPAAARGVCGARDDSWRIRIA